MSNSTSATIAIVAPHDVQAEIQRLFKLSASDRRRALGGDPDAPAAGKFLAPELCIDHVNLYYIDGDDSWRYDVALAAKRFPQAKVYYKEMHDQGKAGACTNDAEARFFMPYEAMVTNSGVLSAPGVDMAEVRRACSEIWTKQTNGFKTQAEADAFIAEMHRTFPKLDSWIAGGFITLWINHFPFVPFDTPTKN